MQVESMESIWYGQPRPSTNGRFALSGLREAAARSPMEYVWVYTTASPKTMSSIANVNMASTCAGSTIAMIDCAQSCV